jgi:hypothetical protein
MRERGKLERVTATNLGVRSVRGIARSIHLKRTHARLGEKIGNEALISETCDLTHPIPSHIHLGPAPRTRTAKKGYHIY